MPRPDAPRREKRLPRMPRPDALRPEKRQIDLSFAMRLLGRRKRPRETGGGLVPEPVEPDRPNSLSGGAAAALEFDDE